MHLWRATISVLVGQATLRCYCKIEEIYLPIQATLINVYIHKNTSICIFPHTGCSYSNFQQKKDGTERVKILLCGSFAFEYSFHVCILFASLHWLLLMLRQTDRQMDKVLGKLHAAQCHIGLTFKTRSRKAALWWLIPASTDILVGPLSYG